MYLVQDYVPLSETNHVPFVAVAPEKVERPAQLWVADKPRTVSEEEKQRWLGDSKLQVVSRSCYEV